MENDRSPVALVAGFTNRSSVTNNNNLSYHVSLMISKTLNRFQNIGKAINLRILDQHFQNFRVGKKDIQFIYRQHNFLSCSPFVTIRLASSKRLSEETPFSNMLKLGLSKRSSMDETIKASASKYILRYTCSGVTGKKGVPVPTSNLPGALLFLGTSRSVIET